MTTRTKLTNTRSSKVSHTALPSGPRVCPFYKQNQPLAMEEVPWLPGGCGGEGLSEQGDKGMLLVRGMLYIWVGVMVYICPNSQ